MARRLLAMRFLLVQGRYRTCYFVIVPSVRTRLMKAPVQSRSVAQEDSEHLALLSFLKKGWFESSHANEARLWMVVFDFSEMICRAFAPPTYSACLRGVATRLLLIESMEGREELLIDGRR